MEQLTILVADDNKITTDILQRMLRPYSNDILVAENGRIGLELFKAHRPEIVLSDVNMPEMGGLEMIEQIRALDRNVKIALFTNFERQEILRRAIDYGVNQFFCKPFEADHFAEVIQNLCDNVLARRRIRAELARQQEIMLAVNAIAQGFLQHTDWQETLERQLHRLKDAARTTAIFLYKNDDDTTNNRAAKLLAVNDDDEAVARETIDYLADGLSEWQAVLRTGESINGSIEAYDESKQQLLVEFRIDTLLILPIFVGGAWWGFLGIGNNARQPFKPGDVEMLGTVTSIVGSAINNQQNLQALQLSSNVLKHTVDGVLVTDADNKIIHVNDAFSRITGYTAEKVIGKDPKILKSGRHDTHFYKSMWEQIRSDGYWQGEITNRKHNGEIYIEWLSINTIKNSKGETEKYIGIFSDVTYQRKDAADYAYQATHDPLTDLPNRLLLGDRLQHAIDHANRFNKCVAVIFCDLDDFKPINDTYGHSTGDEVLKSVAKSMKGILRKEDTVCRFGGDEFIILIEDLYNFEFLDGIVNKIRELSQQKISTENAQLQVEMSIGVAVYPNDADDAQTLIDNADDAMYRAKHGGKNNIAYVQEDTRGYCTVDITI